MQYKKLSEQEEFLENPFIQKAVEDIRIVKKTQTIRPKGRGEIQMIVSGDEVTGHSAFMRIVEVDEDKFAKLYLSQLCAFWDLSKPALRVFSYVLTTLQPKKDSFIFLMDECIKYTGYSQRNHIITGLSNLIEAGIIARSKYSFRYFINPLVIFNGDRVTFAKTYIKKVKKLEINPNQMDIFDSQQIKPQLEQNN
jgi:intergrase/recombinase